MSEQRKWPPELVRLIEGSIVTLTSKDVSKALARHILMHYPPTNRPSGGIDWMQIPDGLRTTVESLSAVEMSMFILSTKLSLYSNLVIVRSAREEGLIVSLPNTLKYLEVLASPRVTYIAGLLSDTDSYQLAFDHFIEIKRDEFIWVSGFPR